MFICPSAVADLSAKPLETIIVTVGFSGIQTRIVRVYGKHEDLVTIATTATAQDENYLIFNLNKSIIRSSNGLTEATIRCYHQPQLLDIHARKII